VEKKNGKKKVLCVCKMNVCRSPMMAALLQEKLGHEFEVESVGTYEEAKEGLPVNPYSASVLRERGLEIGKHKSRWIGNIRDLNQFAYIVCADAVTVVTVLFSDYNGTVTILLSADPYGKELPAYREYLGVLEKTIPDIANMIRRAGK